MALIKITGDIVSSNTITGNNIATGTVTTNNISSSVNLGGPKISSIVYPGDDTAADTAGGQTIVLTGNGFNTGASVLLDGVAVGTVSVTNSTSMSFTAPAKSTGSYIIYVVNTDGSTAIAVPGLQYSGVPTWVTSAGAKLANVYETAAYSNTVSATGDGTITYAYYAGTLPPGATLAANGQLSGTSQTVSSPTDYTFTIRATDAQNQDTDRTFNVTINPDVVTWSAPANNATITTYEYVAISNTFVSTSAAGKSIAYSANVLPANVSISGGVVSGTPTTVGNTTSLITATANTTGKISTQTLNFVVQQDAVTWSSPADNATFTWAQNAANTASLVATSAAGFGVTYSANVLPAGLSVSGNTITGTPTAAGNTTSLITATAATTGRTATRTFNWVISVGGDTNWKNTALLVSANTPSQSNTFTNDASLNSIQSTIIGDVKPVAMHPYQDGYYSVQYNGTANGVISIPHNSGLSIMSGSSNTFVAECWVYWNTVLASSSIMDKSGRNAVSFPNWAVELDASKNIRLQWGASGSPGTSAIGIISSGVIPVPGRWYHIALVKSNADWSLFVDGVRGATYNGLNTANDANPAALRVGFGLNTEANATYLNGYISNVRVYNGPAVSAPYSATSTTLTLPTAPFTDSPNIFAIVNQSNRQLDTSIVNATITAGSGVRISSVHPYSTPTNVAYNTQYSVYFDGTGDNLTIPSSAATNISSGDFTVEMWFRTSVVTGDISQYLIDSYFNGVNRFMMYSFNNTMYAQWISAGAGKNINTTFAANTWYHIAFVKSGNVYTLYLNGNSVGTPVTDANALATGDTVVTIGRSPTAGGPLFGYISNLRFVKGTAVYTSNFTPPTSPLTAISGTSVLTCQDSTIKDNSSNALAITSTADARPVAVSPFTKTTSNTMVTSLGSAYFDGTGDYITWTPGGTGRFGTGDFTVELWFYPTATMTTQYLLDMRDALNTTGWVLAYGVNVSGSITWYNGTGNLLTEASPLTKINQWNHVAFCRSGTSNRLFINGVQTNVTVSDSTDYNNNNATAYIGSRFDQNSSVTSLFTGYMSNVRIVKGAALYTANFLPSQTTLTPVANTQLLTLQYNNDADNNGIVDQSRFNNLITTTGNATEGTFSPYSPNGWSYYYPALAFNTYAANPIGTFGTGATFTVEGWVNMAAYPTTNYFFNLLASCDQSTLLYWSIGVGSTGLVTVYWYDGNAKQAAGSTTLARGTWYHVAVVVTSGVVTIYVNGNLQTLTGTTTLTNPTGNASYTTGTDRGASNGGSAGYISNLRISTSAVYSSAFTPSTTPLSPAISSTVFASLLTAQNGWFVDNSPNLRAITLGSTAPTVQAFSPFGNITNTPTSYSVYFDGTGDYLTVPGSSNFVFAGDYTIEAWIYTSNTTWSVYSTGGSGATDQFSCDAGTLYWAYNIFGGGTANFFTTADTNKWTHVAASRSSGTTRLFKNGVVMATSTTNTSIGSTNTLNIGRRLDGVYLLNGYLSNFRIVKGTALYTGAFTPPTTPLTAVANTLLLTCQSSTLIDNSANIFAVTGVGDSKPVPFNPFGATSSSNAYSLSVNGGSVYFDGTGDFLSAATSSSFDLSAGPWTIECWFYQLAGKTVQLFSVGASAWRLAINSSQGGEFTFNTNSSMAIPNGTFLLNQWNHIAVTYNADGTSSAVKTFANGKWIGSGQFWPSASTSTFYVGRNTDAGSGWDFNGYISDIAITKGRSKYNGNFVPSPTPLSADMYTAFLLSGTSGGIIDYHGSSNLETAANTQLAPENPYAGTYYSNLLDGATTSTYFRAAANTAFDFPGDFTIEFWARKHANGSNGYDCVVGTDTAGTGANWFVELSSSRGFLMFAGSSSRISNNTITVNDGIWHHYAISRTSGTLYMFRDGTQIATASYATAISSGNVDLYIGIEGTYPFNGYLSNLRIVKGTGLYTTNFTPSTTPLTAISGTSILTCQSNKFIDNSASARALTQFGKPYVQSTNPFRKNSGTSVYFDGTDDFLSVVNNPVVNVSRGDYTAECWFYTTQSNQIQTLLWINGNTNAYSALRLGINGSAINFYVADGSGSWGINSGDIAAGIKMGQWYHIAVTRAGSDYKVFLDGTQIGTTYTAPSTVYGTGTLSYFGALNNAGGGSAVFRTMYGYIADIRLTTGVARYTTTFTPPTAPLDVK